MQYSNWVYSNLRTSHANSSLIIKSMKENAMEKWLNDINDTCDSHMTCTSLDLCDLMLFQYHTQYEYEIKFIC